MQEPSALDYIGEASDRLIKALCNNEKIALLVDCDTDGFTSSALLKNYIDQQMMPYGSFPDSTAEIVPLFHVGKTHGLADTKIMRQLRDEIKPTLLIVPDASGTSEQYQALVDIGIDIIVLDHHDMPERGDGVRVIVVNNQQSGGYKNKNLSGVGVVWQFCRYLDSKLDFVCADQYLDLVAIGLVADVMDMRSDETRFLIQEGLKPENMHSPLSQLAPEIFNKFEKMDVHFVGWSIGPGVNAVTRIGTEDEIKLGFGCFLDENMKKMVPNKKRGCTGNTEFVREAWRIVTNAKGRQDRRRNKLTEMVERLIQEENLAENKVIVLAIDDYEPEYRALSGVVANALIEIYQRPVLLTFLNDDGDYQGSMRAPEHVEAWAKFKDICAKSGFCRYASGHQLAAGVCIYGESVIDLIDYFNEKFSEMDTEPSHTVDFVFEPDDPRIADLCWDLDKVGDIWGQGIEAPTIAIKGVKVGAGLLDLVGKTSKTLRITLPNGITAVKFRSSNEEFQSLALPYTSPQQFYEVDIVGIPQINRWAQYENPQILITDYEVRGVVYDF